MRIGCRWSVSTWPALFYKAFDCIARICCVARWRPRIYATAIFLKPISKTAGSNGPIFAARAFYGADLNEADLANADLVSADLSGANLEGVNLTNADLGNTNLKGIRWQKIASIQGANVGEVREAPDGFVAWARKHGAVETPLDDR
jgi:Pentapeptide repeats (8 copies)